MKLSENFSLAEFTRTGRDLENVPNAAQINAMMELCDNVLELVREHFKKPIIITSGFRSAAVNAAVGGSLTSQHSKGEAADFHIVGVANSDIWQFIVNNCCFDQCIAEKLDKKNGAKGWCHVSYKPRGNRHQELSYVNGKYLKGLVFEK